MQIKKCAHRSRRIKTQTPTVAKPIQDKRGEQIKMSMILTDEQQAVLNGSRGETMAKIMKTLVMYGETFGAEKLVPVTGKKGHLVTSFGLGVMKPVYKLVDELIDSGALSGQPFTADPRPLDKNVPANLLQKLVFKYMYSKQTSY